MEGKLGHLEWSAKDVAIKLKEKGLPEAARKLEEHKICGEFLVMLTEDRLKAMGINLYGDILKILKFIEQITEVPPPPVDFNMFKIFNDPINGHTAIHPLCVKIIDTPQFQRLRYLKQGGACYFVYPGAANNRFEHSIGVCHMAGELARTLQTRQPELEISENDILCVQIAGLCHDLGHGPFSHLFDNKFLPSVIPDIKWKHENGSVMMFQHVLDKWHLMEEFKKYGLDKTDVTFIKEQITCSLGREEKIWSFSGRGKKKSFLYEIVSNNRNGIDVDKWDYFARDCQLLGIQNTFDHQRFMQFVRVLNVDDRLQICFKYKEAETLYGLFLNRATLQKRAYKHRVVNAIEFMIKDAFIHAEKKGLIPGKHGIPIRLSKCIDDPVAYTQLNDSIFHMILMSTDDDLKEAREILQRIELRQLYSCVGETVPTKQDFEKEDVRDIKKDILSYIPESSSNLLEENDIEFDVVVLDYGHNTKNPFDTITFYKKEDVLRPYRLDSKFVPLMVPSIFSEKFVRLYCKKPDAKCLEVATESFEKWCAEKDLPLQKIQQKKNTGADQQKENTGADQQKEDTGANQQKEDTGADQPEEIVGPKKRKTE